jgi:hypothetical protein
MLSSSMHVPVEVTKGPAAGKEFVKRAKELGVKKCPACNKSLVEKPARKRKKHG